MLETILSSFSLVLVSEMGDKTQLLAFTLAARFKSPWPVLGGILVATVLNHSLASLLGGYVASQFSPHMIALALGILFILFGIWTLKPDTLDAIEGQHRFGPFVTTAFLFFLAEMGDKTQFATMALAAKFQSVVGVTLGTTLGMMVTDGLAVFLGDRLSQKIQMNVMRWIAAGLFFLFGAISFVEYFRV